MLKILGIIPVRKGSKGIKNKNLLKIKNKSLFKITIDEVKKSKLKDNFLVTTNDERIIKICIKEDIKFINRPEYLCTDKASSIDTCIHAVKTVDKNNFYDGIMMLQVTTPFRKYMDINSCIKLFNEKSLDSIISLTDVGAFHPARMKYVKRGFIKNPEFCEKRENQPRQELEPVFIRNGAIYLTRKKTLFNKSFMGKKSKAYFIEEERSVNIDNYNDLNIAKLYANKFL